MTRTTKIIVAVVLALVVTVGLLIVLTMPGKTVTVESGTAALLH